MRKNSHARLVFYILLKVLFWLYGGGLSTGGEVFYDASVLASLHDVVVVIPNYRVNVFGFLSLGPDSDHPGNAGLVDQVMALQYVLFSNRSDTHCMWLNAPARKFS